MKLCTTVFYASLTMPIHPPQRTQAINPESTQLSKNPPMHLTPPLPHPLWVTACTHEGNAHVYLWTTWQHASNTEWKVIL